MNFSMPLKVRVSSKKYFILNLNNYRNAHHRVLSTAKRNYQDIFFKIEFKNWRKFNKVKLHYIIYPASKREFDLLNVISIHDKFIMDAIVKRGMLPDDCIKHVPYMPTAEVKPVDRSNPRIEVFIEDIE